MDTQPVAVDLSMLACCGACCGICAWRDNMHCPGCRAGAGVVFWGRCDKAACCIGRGYDHCGLCPELPCDKLLALFSDPEHGDEGARLNNLRDWASGVYTCRSLNNPAQQSAKERSNGKEPAL